MQRKFNFELGEYYHLFTRGVEKRDIFMEEHDKKRFLKLLFVCNSTSSIDFRNIDQDAIFSYDRGKTIVDIGAYCLMTNHLHILVREKEEGGISKFLQKLLTGYSMYFNKKHQRTGALFEGKFRAKHLDDDTYLRYIYSYIHLNPLSLTNPGWKQHGIADVRLAENDLTRYPYSSYSDYQQKLTNKELERQEAKILEPNSFPHYFSETVSIGDELRDWLEIHQSGTFETYEK